MDRVSDISPPPQRPWTRTDILLLGGVFLLPVILDLLAGTAYPLHMDEYYLVVAGHTPAWGYVDAQPLIAWTYGALRALTGGGPVAMRVALAFMDGTCLALLACLVRLMGGGRYAQFLAAVAMYFCPMHLTIFSYLGPNALDHILWASVACSFLLVLRYRRLWNWVALGCLFGIGLQNRISILVLSAGLGVGILVGPHRRQLLTLGPYLGATVAILLVLPNLLWQAVHGWPSLLWLAEVVPDVSTRNTLSAYILMQATAVFPLNWPIFVAGVLFLVLRPEGKPYRVLGWALVFTMGLFLLQRGRPHYCAPAYSIAFAGGAVAIERLVRARHWRRAAIAYPVCIVLLGAVVLPFFRPVLDSESLLQYKRFLTRNEDGPQVLPPVIRMYVGWEELAEAVTKVYHSLPPEGQDRCAILTAHYSSAAVLHTHFPEGTPPILCAHNQFYFWGYGEATGELIIALGQNEQYWRQYFEEVQLAKTFDHPLAWTYLRNKPIFICRDLKMPMAQAWEAWKRLG